MIKAKPHLGVWMANMLTSFIGLPTVAAAKGDYRSAIFGWIVFFFGVVCSIPSLKRHSGCSKQMGFGHGIPYFLGAILGGSLWLAGHGPSPEMEWEAIWWLCSSTLCAIFDFADYALWLKACNPNSEKTMCVMNAKGCRELIMPKGEGEPWMMGKTLEIKEFFF